jgi:serine/threonine-protein kinase
VQHAHQRLVVHRDLKPRNVRVRPDGEPRLLDFGVAKLLDLGTAGTRDTSTRVWTPGYASPEQQRGDQVTTATDVYSLGVMLRELLTGERADARGAVAAPAGFVMVEPDAELRGVIALATATEPEQRYPSVEALRDDLARWRDGRPLRAARDSGWYRARKFVARHRLGTLAVAAVLVGAAVFVWRLGAERDRALAAEAAAVAARQDAEAAREETQRQLQRASQAVEFVGALFGDAAPDRNGGRPVDVRQLVALGEARLDAAAPRDPGVAADMATLLGQLNLRLGAAEDAIRLLRRGLAGQEPHDATTAAEIAMRHDLLANALLEIDRRDEALVEAEAARALRERWLADDAAARTRTAYSMGLVLYALRRFDEAADRLAETLALMRDHPGTTDIETLDARTLAAGVDVDRARFADALAAVDAALAEPGDAATRRPTLLIEAYRTRARALQGLGRLTEAAAAFDAAIAKHREIVGDRGARIAGLHNDHGILLAQLGRFVEAVAAYDAGANAYAEAGGSPREDDTRYLNNICDAWNGHGDYARAALACNRAVALMRERRPPGDIERLFVDSQNARTLGLLGRHAEAAAAFDSVVERTTASLGETAFPLAIHLYRAARAAQLAGDLARAERLAARARPIFESTLASPHHWRGRMARLRGGIALARGDFEAADAGFAEAADEFARSLPAGHFLSAQVEADRAALALARGDADAARRMLAPAVGILRASCAPTEVDRVVAERLARRLDLPQR